MTTSTLNHGVQIELFPFTDKGVMPVKKDMLPGYGRHSSEKSKSPGVTDILILLQQPRQQGGVIINNNDAEKPPTLIADFQLNIILSGQLFLPPTCAIAERS